MTYIKKCFSIVGRAILGFSLSIPLASAGNDQPNVFSHVGATMVNNNTKFVWMLDGSTPSIGNCAGGKKTWSGALDYAACLNSIAYCGFTDWRLPTVGELSSLGSAITERGGSVAATLNANGFTNMKSAYYWGSSGDSNKNISMVVDMLWDGQSHPVNQSSRNYVLVIRTAGGGKTIRLSQ